MAIIKNRWASETKFEGDDTLKGLAQKNKADLRGAKIKFQKFPSIAFLSNIQLGTLPDKLTLELMRRDMFIIIHDEDEQFESLTPANTKAPAHATGAWTASARQAHYPFYEHP